MMSQHLKTSWVILYLSIKKLIEGTEKRLCKLELVDVRVESLEESPGFHNHYEISIRDHVHEPKFGVQDIHGQIPKHIY